MKLNIVDSFRVAEPDQSPTLSPLYSPPRAPSSQNNPTQFDKEGELVLGFYGVLLNNRQNAAAENKTCMDRISVDCPAISQRIAYSLSQSSETYISTNDHAIPSHIFNICLLTSISTSQESLIEIIDERNTTCHSWCLKITR